MSAAEYCAAIDRLHELERMHALPAETLRLLDAYWREKIFGINGSLSKRDRIIVQDYYIESLRRAA